MKILVVEDDPTLRLLAKHSLYHLGYECIVAASGEEALTEDFSQISLIFMDIGLPGMDGNQATKLIRETEMKESRARVPIIALTAQATRESVMRAGMDDFLQKPAMLDDLSCMIKKWLPV